MPAADAAVRGGRAADAVGGGYGTPSRSLTSEPEDEAVTVR